MWSKSSSDVKIHVRQTHILYYISAVNNSRERVTTLERCAMHTDIINVLCGFAYLIRIGVQLLQIKIYFCIFSHCT
jgi:hypothetical protein